jgi:hypothetical protein
MIEAAAAVMEKMVTAAVVMRVEIQGKGRGRESEVGGR